MFFYTADLVRAIAGGVRAIDFNDTSYTVRLSIDVIEELLSEMNRLVSSYDLSGGRIGTTFTDLIQGTAFFPGGSGLWRCAKNGGAMPELFPSHPVMFVAHNYDSKKGHDKSLRAGGEVESPFWTTFWLPMLAFAGVDCTKCFFTNVLMGLQPRDDRTT